MLAKRQEIISKHLKPLQINKGLVFCDDINPGGISHTEAHLRSISQFQANVKPVILIKNQDRYEAVDGYEWVSAAVTLEISQVYAWVFDDEDDAAQAAHDLQYL